MKFVIKHEIRGRIRFHVAQKNMSYREADILQYYLDSMKHVSSAKVNHSTCDAVVCYEGSREAMITALRRFHYETADVPESYLANSGRQVNEEYKEKLVDKVLMRCINRMFLPMPIANTLTAIRSVEYITNGLKTLANRKIEVPVLDGTAIGVSVFRGDFQTAGSIMFLLGIGEILEEWTHKKSVGDLARSMSLNIGKVWLKKDGQDIHVKAGETVTLLSRRLQLSMTPDQALFDRYTKRIRFKDEKLGNILRVINLQNPDIRLETTPELWNRTLTVTFFNDTPEAMAELICLALDLKKTRQDNMILLFN